MTTTLLSALIFALAPIETPAVTTAEALRTHVKYLASEELEGRMTGSKGERLAGDYAMKWFKQHGLLPAGTVGTYFQEFQASYGAMAGEKCGLTVTPSTGNQVILEVGKDFNPVVNSAQGPPVEATLVFAGEGIVTEERNDYEQVEVKDKIVVVFPSADRQFGNREKARWAREKGAVGVIFAGPAVEDGPALSPVSRRTAISRDSDLIAVAITAKAFERIGGLSYAEASRQAKAGRVLPGFAQGVKVQVQVEIVPIKATGRNVMALLPGSDSTLKNQYIIIGAHVDHLGRGEFGSGSGAQKIHPGADDNASGTAMVLELARYFAETKSNRRSLLFQLYSGEELGLLGSSFFVKNPTINAGSVSCMFNLDMLGNLKESKLLIDGIRSSPAWLPMITKLAADYNVTRDRPDLGGRSDHGPWEHAGVPVLFFFTGEHERYHRETDTYEHLNYEGMERIAATVAQFIKEVDGANDMLPFKKGTTVTKRTAPGASGGEAGARRVRVGLIPDYADSGPGVLLAGVVENSAAERAGLRRGDRIVKWADKKIETIEDIQEVFTRAEPGKTVLVTIIRDGREVLTAVKPDPPEA